jgi:hypothetical protein
MLRRAAFGLALVVSLCGAAIAQDAQPPASEPQSTVPQPSDAQIAAATDLLDATHVQQNVKMIVDTMLPVVIKGLQKDHPNASDKAIEAFTAAFDDEIQNSMGDILKLEARVYAEHFSEDELHQLAAFYRSDLGQKYLTEVPGIMKEMAPMSMAWAQAAALRAGQKAAERLKKDGVQL